MADEKRPSDPNWRVDPAPDGRGTPPEKKPPMVPFSFRRFLTIVVVLLAANYLFVAIFAPEEDRKRVPYTPLFVQQIEKKNVKEISSKGSTVQGEFKKDVKGSKKFETEVPTFADTDELSADLERAGVTVNAKPAEDRSLLETLLFSFGPTLLLVGLFIFLIRRASRQAGGGGVLGQFGRSRARRAEGGEDTRVNFGDVAGIDEAKEELSEIVDFLRTPEKYAKLGARIPRGVLLSGAPGTGKTLLAKAVAGEAGVPFFSISASEFIEAIVGVGASRVRDLFKQAKEAAPAIIFIDELDAIGRSRSGGGGFTSGGHDEREQTLNQILTEMDGFETGDGVVVLAATNRPEILDKALLRAGRFDRRVTVPPPDKVGRQKILEVHTRSIPLADDADLEALAQATPGMVGADLANVVNEAALLAARRGHDRVAQADLTDAIEKIVLGTERKVVQSEEDRRRIAYHEGGHAIVGMLTAGADPVRKVSIIPRGQSLGVTLSAPDADVFNYSEAYLRGKIKVAVGGRVAEEVAFGTITTGAESDIQQATMLARGMVGRWGMSEDVGFVAVEPMDGQSPFLPGASPVSEATRRLIDGEVRRIIDEAQDEVRGLLDREREKLDALAEALLREETLDEADAYRAAGIDRAAAPRVSEELGTLVARALAEDLGSGDLTAAAVVPEDARAVAVVEQRAPGVVFGLDVAREVFAQAGEGLAFKALAPEGEWRNGGEVARIEGPARAILAGERVALNFLGRLSGIATLTARYVQAVEGTGARILDTRKTTPGLRALEKAAVVAGGGVSHRAGLHDAILVKENHAALAGGVGEAARRAIAGRGPAKFVEAEVESLAQLDEVLDAGVDRILLDNMSPADMATAVERAAGRAQLEASGGISLESVRAVAETGVDFISVGALTHSAPALDLSLLVAPG